MWEEGYIAGAVTLAEGRRLAHFAGACPAGEAIVELGSHGGSSTSWLALGSKKGNGAEVHAVDPWDLAVGDRMDQHAESAVRARFDAQLSFMASAGYIDPDCVTAHRGFSVDVARSWDATVGMLHVDALHTYEAVTADLDAWLPFVPPGGVVVLHDYCDPRFGVRRAGDEMADGPEWAVVGVWPGGRRKKRHGQMVLRRR